VQNPNAKHIRRVSWAITGLEAGVVLFAVGLTLLYLNPFWHFDESGFLDWRVHWWNAASTILTAAGLWIVALALIGSVAVIVSRFAGRHPWPYGLAALLVVGGRGYRTGAVGGRWYTDSHARSETEM